MDFLGMRVAWSQPRIEFSCHKVERRSTSVDYNKEGESSECFVLIDSAT